MHEKLLMLLSLTEVMFLGVFLWVLPRIGRHGLLFGVYVGEEGSSGERAKEIVRLWNRRIAATIAAAAGLAILAGVSLTPLWAYPVGPCLLLIGSIAAYLSAHTRSRALASTRSPEAVAVVDGEEGIWPVFALAATLVALLGGSVSVIYSWLRYPSLPERIPIHFGFDGRPDGWAVRSWGSVMVLPLLSLVVSAGVGGVACLTLFAKKAVRGDDRGRSLSAQRRFRSAMSRFLSGICLMVTALMTSVSLSAVRVMTGEAERIPSWVLSLAGGLVIYCFAGVIYLALRHGQGGAKHEGTTSAPLTNGLADNRCWRWGVFYVNRDDPSILVEHRFGLGYTLNFGNLLAVALFAGFLVLVLGLSSWALLSI